MALVVVGDVEIYWESHGQGAPVLLISGVRGGIWSWEEGIAAWAPHFRVIAFDNVGSGLSSMPDRPYRIEEMADHAAAVLSAAQEKRAKVVGLSMGGMIAQELVLRHPDRVSRLVLGSTHCGGKVRVPPALEVIERFADNQGLSPEEIIDKNLAIMVTPEFLGSGSDAVRHYKERQLRAPFQPDYALQRQLAAVRGFDACDRLDSIDIPTFILTGDRDQVVPPENSRLLANRIPGSVKKVFAGAGHLLHLECAESFYQIVARFFENEEGVRHEA